MFYIILVAAIYLIIIAMMMKTHTILDFALFRALPFLLGLPLLYHAVKGLGWLQYL